MKELADLEAPATVTRRLLEKDVQKQCVDWARAQGYWARKFSSMTSAAEPDYIFAKIGYGLTDKHFIHPKFATEFKAPGKTSTPLQLEEQAKMRLAGWFVFECDNLALFQKTVLEYERVTA